MKKIIYIFSFVFCFTSTLKFCFGQDYTLISEKFYENGSHIAYFESNYIFSYEQKIFLQKEMEQLPNFEQFSFFDDNEKLFMYKADTSYSVDKVVDLMRGAMRKFTNENLFVIPPTDEKGLRADPCANVSVMVCGKTYQGTLGTEGNFLNYTESCGFPEEGEEKVFAFMATITGTYTISATVSSGECCFHVMDACNNTANNVLSNGCWLGGNGINPGNRTVSLTEGQVIFIIVDNAYSNPNQPVSATFTIRVGCLGGSTTGTTQPSNVCSEALPFCTSEIYSYPMAYGAQGLGTKACCLSTPSPTWYYLKIDQPGNLNIYMTSPRNDIDFVCWGPFNSPAEACANYQSSCGGCPNNTSSSAHYPYGNVVDCSFDPAHHETCHINGANTGEYYLLLITNFSNTYGTITFSQLSGDAKTDCSIVFPMAINNGPLCVGDTLRLSTSLPIGDENVLWVKPDGSYSQDTLFVIPNVTLADTGTYSLVITGFGEATQTRVEIFAPSDTTFFIDSICADKLPDSLYGFWIENLTSQIYVADLHNIHGCDSIVVLDLTVLRDEKTFDTVIMCKELLPYTFYDSIFDSAGSYCVVIACFTHYLELILPTPINIELELPSAICADAGSFVVEFKSEEANDLLPVKYTVNFSDYAIENGFTDIQNPYSDSVKIYLPYSVYPNEYNFNVNFEYNVDGCPIQSKTALFTVLYPSSIMKQKWDNVIALYNYSNNGHYDFSYYQWYKNGEILFEEKSSYLHINNINVGDEYSVEITRADDTKCFSCPLILNNAQPLLSDFPNIVQSGNTIEIQYTNKVKNVKLWTVTGILYKEFNPIYPVQHIELPAHSGYYILDVQLTNNNRKGYNVVVK
ncbi:hypothetical protein FACS1894178_0880 [Bacteroidia bacterium]|nr:hypothetical protein FACS1894178_0880 [Bacteroidia bacterium]